MAKAWWNKPDAERAAPSSRDWVRVRRQLGARPIGGAAPAVFLAPAAEFYPTPGGHAGAYPPRPTWPTPLY